jgi:hypothetical protein
LLGDQLRDRADTLPADPPPTDDIERRSRLATSADRWRRLVALSAAAAVVLVLLGALQLRHDDVERVVVGGHDGSTSVPGTVAPPPVRLGLDLPTLSLTYASPPAILLPATTTTTSRADGLYMRSVIFATAPAIGGAARPPLLYVSVFAPTPTTPMPVGNVLNGAAPEVDESNPEVIRVHRSNATKDVPGLEVSGWGISRAEVTAAAASVAIAPDGSVEVGRPPAGLTRFGVPPDDEPPDRSRSSFSDYRSATNDKVAISAYRDPGAANDTLMEIMSQGAQRSGTDALVIRDIAGRPALVQVKTTPGRATMFIALGDLADGTFVEVRGSMGAALSVDQVLDAIHAIDEPTWREMVRRCPQSPDEEGPPTTLLGSC